MDYRYPPRGRRCRNLTISRSWYRGDAAWETTAAKVWEFVSRPIKLPGWAALIVGVICYIPDWKSRWDFRTSVFGSNTAVLRMMASALASPYVGFALIVSGLIYLYFARGVMHVRHGEFTAGVKADASVPTEVRRAIWLPIRDLFAHIHPQPVANDADRNAVGRDVIDQISSGQLAVWGRRIDGSKRSALEPIPFENWKHAQIHLLVLGCGQRAIAACGLPSRSWPEFAGAAIRRHSRQP
jgi:hypothetical protein